MSHYEERLERDISLIRQKTAELADKVEISIKNAVKALLTGNNELSYDTIIRDNIINRDNEEVARKCYAFIARHLPSAGHLRRVASILHICVFLERIGDQAVSISKVAVQLAEPIDELMIRHIERLEEEAGNMLKQSVTAFNEDNFELAKSTKHLDSYVDNTFRNAYADLSREENKKQWLLKDTLGMLSVCYSLERVSDLAKNICEKTIYSVSGQTKIRKPVNILFLAESNNYLVQMAEAIGKKSFSECGSFSSAGKVAEAVEDPIFTGFMQERGLDFERDDFKTIEMLPRLDEYMVIISLQGDVSSYISAIPFNVIVLTWDVGNEILESSDGDKTKWFQESSQLLADNIHNLLEIMRGEEAVCGAG